MSRPRVLTLWLDSWYGRGTPIPSSEVMQFGGGLFDSIGFEEVHIPLELWRDDPREAEKRIKSKYPYEWAFVVPFDEVLYPLKELIREAPLVAWMSDCVWRYSNFGRYWQHSCDLIVTTDAETLPKYGERGILLNWACRPEWVKQVENWTDDLRKRPKASFHGQMYGDRLDKIMAIDRGPVQVDFCDSAGYGGPETLTGYFTEIARATFALCLTAASNGVRPQMKARMFEPQLFGTILVTEPVPTLGEWWEPGEECIVFESPEEAQAKMQALLDSPATLSAMAERAKARVLAEHTYQHRLEAILSRLGLRK